MKLAAMTALAFALAACATEPSTPLPEGRYALTWSNTGGVDISDAPALVGAQQLVVLPGRLAIDQLTIAIATCSARCACTTPMPDIPAFAVCDEDDGTLSGVIDWPVQVWSFEATSVVAR